MSKFETANDIVIQSGFRNPEFKSIPADQANPPSAGTDGRAIPKSERALVVARANTDTFFEVAFYGSLRNKSNEWVYVSTMYVDDRGAQFPWSGSGPYDRVAAAIVAGEQANVDTLEIAYPIYE